jgi:uncharacterized membrane protein
MPTIGGTELAFIALMLLMFVVVPVSLIVLLARSIRGERDDIERPDPAMDVLRTRYASGEIDQTEFERLRSTMQRR